MSMIPVKDKWRTKIASASLRDSEKSGSHDIGNGKEVIIYSCMSEVRENALQIVLKKKFPNYSCVVIHRGTGECGTELLAQGTGAEADIVVGLQCAILEKVQDSLAAIASFDTSRYIDAIQQYNPAHRKYGIWEKYDGVIVINRRVLEQNKLPTPKTYYDLINPVYRKQIVMPDPRFSGAGYMFLNEWCGTWKEEVAFAYMDELAKNITRFVSSGHYITNLLLSDDVGIGFIDLMNIYKCNDSNLQYIAPESGAPYNITGTAIISGKENKKPVHDVYEWLMSEYILEDKVYFSPGCIFKDQPTANCAYPTVGNSKKCETLQV